MKENYDVIIVGGGPAAIVTASEFMVKDPKKSILLIDKGLDIDHRTCPILQKKIKQCPQDIYGNSGCKPSCSMTSGFGGCGAFSDGKFNITSDFGGWMTDYLPDEEVLDLIRYVDSINLKHGAPQELTNPQSKEVYEIEKKGIAVGLKLLRSEVRHLGTEINLNVLKDIYETLKKHIDFLFATEVKDLLIENDVVKGVVLQDDTTIASKYVVLGVGRPGAEWLTKTLTKHKVRCYNNRVDVGVRVETNNIIMDEINKYLYEGKFIYSTSLGTQVRTFCSNPSGYVVIENHNGVMVCNGHSYHNSKLGSDNTNFALLVSLEFDDPFKNPNEYAKEISELANKLSGGSVIVQKFGDILLGRRSTKKRIEEGFVKPTLKEAVPGDLGLILPYKTMKSIIEMIQALNYVTPGIANDHTLFYGVEAKFYSDRVDVTNEFETKKIKNLFVGGDGAGITRGLAQAGANGVKIARTIIQREK
ncbi:MAG TPA: NAD(P)/FAD-dependent oxidoreductase [Candidatus Caccosoma faecigallinarum]|uniref:NAD(P)/FAD-dependent oxidoreductase n=1 Tax=Candidatus Caccosoma faecigallinarum TaxID=2840720 RepID=A0A9D1KAG8_9FIRM|nr:NAD(P)/FAD-dependent oxidoreductase [Candidatus Caccosoma faecigallinarum]